MNIANLENIVRIFRGTEPSAEERDALFKEVLLMTLARATHTDSNVNPCEVATVQRILKKVTGEEFSEADVRVAAASELYQTAPLDRYLARVGQKLSARQRSTTAQALAEVIRSDTQVNTPEVQFFNSVAQSLHLSPAELVGLVPAD